MLQHFLKKVSKLDKNDYYINVFACNADEKEKYNCDVIFYITLKDWHEDIEIKRDYDDKDAIMRLLTWLSNNHTDVYNDENRNIFHEFGCAFVVRVELLSELAL